MSAEDVLGGAPRSEVASCRKCSGTGFVSHEELTNYHRGGEAEG